MKIRVVNYANSMVGDKAKHEFVTSSFLYNKLEPNAKTTIIVKGPFREKEYNVDFSMIK